MMSKPALVSGRAPERISGLVWWILRISASETTGMDVWVSAYDGLRKVVEMSFSRAQQLLVLEKPRVHGSCVIDRLE